MKPSSLIISPRESIASIIDRALLLESSSIVIILPEDADIAQSMVSLKIIHQELTEAGKDVTWKSTSAILRKILERTFTPPAPDPLVEVEPVSVEQVIPPEQAPPPKILIPTPLPISPLPVVATDKKQEPDAEKEKPIEKEAPTEKSPIREPRSSRRLTRSRAVFFVIIAVVLALGSFVAIAPRADIIVVPISEPFVVDLEVAASPNPGPDDISLRWEELRVTVTESMDATGSRVDKTKAKGTVSFVNLYATTPLLVPMGAVFTDDRGETYLLESAISVPGMVIVGPKKDGGVATGTIVAQTEGENGNRGAGSLTMSYPGYESASAADFTATTPGLSGGTEVEKTVVSREDLTRINQAIDQAFMTKIQDEVEQKRQSRETYLPMGWIIAADKRDLSAPEGTEADEVTATRSATVTVGLFDPGEAERALQSLLEIRRGADRLFITAPPFSLKLTLVDTDRRRLILGWHVDTLVSAPINQQLIRDRVRGKSVLEIEALANDEDLFIKRITGHLWPFWVKKVPKSQNRIDVKIKPS